MPDNEIIEDRTEIMKLKLDMKRKGIDPKRLDDLVEYGRVTEAGLKHERYMERARLKKEVEGMGKERFWCGEDPETEEVREMTQDENCSWGGDMTFAWNAAIEAVLKLLEV